MREHLVRDRTFGGATLWSQPTRGISMNRILLSAFALLMMITTAACVTDPRAVDDGGSDDDDNGIDRIGSIVVEGVTAAEKTIRVRWFQEYPHGSQISYRVTWKPLSSEVAGPRDSGTHYV